MKRGGGYVPVKTAVRCPWCAKRYVLLPQHKAKCPARQKAAAP